MGRKSLIDVPDGLVLVMSKDRPFTKREIGEHFSCSESAAASWCKRAREAKHPVRITLKGYWYMGKMTLEYVSALATMQACAAMQSMKMKQLAIECDNVIKQAPKILLLEYRRQSA